MERNLRRPPVLAERLLMLLARERDREAMRGDLLEEFQDGQKAVWYWRQVLKSAGPLAAARWKALLLAMLAGYLVMAAAVITAGHFVNSAAFDLAGGFFFAMLGGYVAARLASGAERWLVAFSILMGVVSMVTSWAEMPWWYHVALIAVMAPGVVLGGYLREGRMRTWLDLFCL